ncbi:DUF3180 family protein [Kineococcus sp. R8]|uniref:DUF3180 family protein n=1 Tax=Kineococcus siccus TaxID=2696567 RepID=UPI0014121914|nr:DUF3180 family protein [Kineococcus siccus]
MRPTRGGVLVAVVVVVAAVTWSGLRIWTARGGTEPELLWRTVLTIGLLAVAVFGLGWPVRQWVRGDKSRRIDALRAARTAALAKSASYAGALLIGFFAGYVVHFVPTADIAARRSQLVLGVADLVVSALLLAAGLIVERWCRVPPEDDDRGTLARS